jgi:uncharacterized protein YdiU (UPF0061 family)
VDYSIFWRRLSQGRASGDFGEVRDLFLDRPAFDTWMLSFSELFAHIDQAIAADLMLKNNPKYVLRNHLGEQAIQAAKAKDFQVLADLLKVLQSPCDEHPAFDAWATFPPEWAKSISISCSS